MAFVAPEFFQPEQLPQFFELLVMVNNTDPNLRPEVALLDRKDRKLRSDWWLISEIDRSWVSSDAIGTIIIAVWTRSILWTLR